jgi:lactate dehydrogenase-like 2-hydroxyacid dehydrogenase
MRGKALEGAVIGIFGMGRIGQSVAEKLATFRPKQIIYHNRRQRPECPFVYVTFGELLAQSDFLLITASASAESQGRFGAEEFGRMKNDAILVNVSR